MIGTSYMQRLRRGSQSQANVGTAERVVSGVAGAALALGGFRRGRSMRGALMGLAGAALLKRALSGYCDIYGALGINTADNENASRPDLRGERGWMPRHMPPQTGEEYYPEEAAHRAPAGSSRPFPPTSSPDVVTEASEESFPASDAPAWTARR